MFRHGWKVPLVLLMAAGSFTLIIAIPGCNNQPSFGKPDAKTPETSASGRTQSVPREAVTTQGTLAGVKRQDKWQEIDVDIGHGVKLEMVLIAAGEFMMGSPESDGRAKGDEKPQHRVRITKPSLLPWPTTATEPATESASAASAVVEPGVIIEPAAAKSSAVAAATVEAAAERPAAHRSLSAIRSARTASSSQWRCILVVVTICAEGVRVRGLHGVAPESSQGPLNRFRTGAMEGNHLHCFVLLGLRRVEFLDQLLDLFEQGVDRGNHQRVRAVVEANRDSIDLVGSAALSIAAHAATGATRTTPAAAHCPHHHCNARSAP